VAHAEKESTMEGKSGPIAAVEGFLLPEKPIPSFEAYLETGGGRGLPKALAMSPAQVIAEVRKANLRGRGGAGFPTGVKWTTIANDPCPTKYFVCNAAEGEPGTFKDRMVMKRNPYQVLEGIAIGAYAVHAKRAFIAMKTSFEDQFRAIRRAREEMTARGFLQVPIEIVRGPEDYLFGEERALLEVIEGKEAMPREKDLPPYILGLFTGYPACLPGRTNPTAVDNCETVSNLSHILANGPEWFRAMGSADTPGTMVFTISGDIRTPGVYELPMGTPMRELIDKYGGGPEPGRRVKAVFSGVTNAALTADHLDTPLDFGSMRRAGSGLGSGGYIVYDDAACMVQVAHMFARFLWLESCGQCNSCKDGGYVATRYLKKIIDGEGDSVAVEVILQAARKAPSGTRCFLPDELAQIVPSIIDNYSEEFVAHFRRGCRNCREPVLPKMHEYDEEKKVFSYSHGRETP
jgi:NADH-quinone oxidoreductase subunit F